MESLLLILLPALTLLIVGAMVEYDDHANMDDAYTDRDFVYDYLKETESE